MTVENSKGCDQDAANRPIREAVQRWARARGLGASQRWVPPGAGHGGLWSLSVGPFGSREIEISVTEAGVAWVEREPGLVKTARGMTMLLNRVEREWGYDRR